MIDPPTHPDTGSVIVPLTRGYEALISPEDAPRVEAFRWRACVRVLYHEERPVSERVYVRRDSTAEERSSGWPTVVYLHRFIAGNVPDMPVDHINGRTLDNRRCNLRVVSYSENSANRVGLGGAAGYRGVTISRSTRGARYRARMGDTHLGIFACAKEAARTYDIHALKILGLFALTNFPLSHYPAMVAYYRGSVVRHGDRTPRVVTAVKDIPF